MTSNDQHGPLLDHDYDGIKELDNDLPRWWVWLFIWTTIWAFAYLAWYHVANAGYLSADEYRLEMDPDYVRWDPSASRSRGMFEPYHPPWYNPQREELVQLGAKGKAVKWVEEKREKDTTTYIAMTDAADLAEGSKTFVRLCVQCHNAQGQGGIGPNLTDDYWIHGAGMTNVTKSIKYGYPEKGMIPWRFQMSPEDIRKVASFVMTLHGTNPPNPKAPQGELVLPTQ